MRNTRHPPIDVAIPAAGGKILPEVNKIMYLCSCGLQRYYGIGPQNTIECRRGRSYYITITAMEFVDNSSPSLGFNSSTNVKGGDRKEHG